MLQVCLNGSWTRRDRADLPIAPGHLAQAAAKAVAAGARDVHLHPKSPDGCDSLEPDVVAAAVDSVRQAVPQIPVGVTTGAWTQPDPTARAALIRRWTVLPDHASVNWHEPGAELVAAALRERSVGIEAGIFSGTDAVARFTRSKHAGAVMRVLAEITDAEPGTAVATARDLLTMLRHTSAPVLLHGEGEDAWLVLEVAASAGCATRIGLEDVFRLPDGTHARDNAELVGAALEVLGRHARPLPASPGPEA